LAAINDKMALIASTPAPRIIFVGTSDLAFGIDSEKIGQAFDMPVVNMGLHGGLGYRFDLEAVRPYIQRGDIIIVSAFLPGVSDILFYGHDDGAGVHLWMLKFRPDIVKAIQKPQQWILLIREYTSFIQSMRQTALYSQLSHLYPVSPVPQVAYRRNGFNEYGDLVAHNDLPSTPWPKAVTSPQPTWTFAALANPISTDAPAYLNDFATFVHEQGATIYAIAPPQPRSLVPDPDQLIPAPELAASIAIPLLGSPVNYLYPDDYFYDAPAHLTKIGREARSEQIIKDLSQVLGRR
jgi:hypothetical protein